MNDLQEVRFGLREGHRLFSDIGLLKRAVQTDERVGLVGNAFTNFYGNFDNNEVFDTYVFCLSEHHPSNMDGILSMWRGYGHHGDGVALVFDPKAITEVPTSPLVISKVVYASDADRLTQLQELLGKSADIAVAGASWKMGRYNSASWPARRQALLSRVRSTECDKELCADNEA